MKKLIAGCLLAGAAILLTGACNPWDDGRKPSSWRRSTRCVRAIPFGASQMWRVFRIVDGVEEVHIRLYDTQDEALVAARKMNEMEEEQK